MRSLLILSLAVCSSACSTDLPIQTVMFVSAGDALGRQVTCLEWTVVKSNGVAETNRFPDNCEGDAPVFPVCLPFAPRGGSPDRARFNAEIRLLGSGGVLATSSVVVSYAEAMQSTLRVHFRDEDWTEEGFCRRGFCPADMRCEGGECLEQCVAVRPTLLPEASEGLSCVALCEEEGCAEQSLVPLRCEADSPCELGCVEGRQRSFVRSCEGGSERIRQEDFCPLRCGTEHCGAPQPSNGGVFPEAQAPDFRVDACLSNVATYNECIEGCRERCACPSEGECRDCASGFEDLEECLSTSCSETALGFGDTWKTFRFQERNDRDHADCGEAYSDFDFQPRTADSPLVIRVDTLYVPAGAILEIRALGPVLLLARESMRIEGRISTISEGEAEWLDGEAGAGGRLGVEAGATTLEPLPFAGRGGSMDGERGGRGGLSLQLSTPGRLYLGPDAAISVGGDDGGVDNERGITAGGGAGGALILESPFLEIEGTIDARGRGRRPREGGPSPFGEDGWVEFVSDMRRMPEAELRARVLEAQGESEDGVRVTFRQMAAD